MVESKRVLYHYIIQYFYNTCNLLKLIVIKSINSSFSHYLISNRASVTKINYLLYVIVDDIRVLNMLVYKKQMLY